MDLRIKKTHRAIREDFLQLRVKKLPELITHPDVFLTNPMQFMQANVDLFGRTAALEALHRLSKALTVSPHHREVVASVYSNTLTFSEQGHIVPLSQNNVTSVADGSACADSPEIVIASIEIRRCPS